jgi:hypothetical protein
MGHDDYRDTGLNSWERRQLSGWSSSLSEEEQDHDNDPYANRDDTEAV